MRDGDDRLSEEAAQRVWRRAADLQASAADAAPREPSSPIDSGTHAGYDLRQIREAAADVGIAPELVALALAEEEYVEPGTHDGISRWAARLSGPGPGALVASRRFDRPIQQVYAAMQDVFTTHHLALVDALGRPLEGGEMVYALPPAGASTMDFVVTELATRARVQTIRARLWPVDDRSCVATLSAPLAEARRAQLASGAALTAGGGVLGGWALGGLGAAVAIPMTLGAGAAAMAIGGAILIGLGAGSRMGIATFRATDRSGRRRGTAALERLLQSIGMAVPDDGRLGRGST